MGIMKTWEVPLMMKGSEWADKYYKISESGREGTSWKCYPYQRFILNAITDPSIERVSVKKSARVGYTKIINIVVGIYAHMNPSDIVIAQPTIEDAEGYSKEEIAPLFEDVPVLRGILKKKRGKDSTNTILHKRLRGMVLSLIGANSPRSTRRINRKIIIMDEINGYPYGPAEEGDFEKRLEMRANNFADKKIIKGSTPTIKGRSRITRNFLEGDQRHFYVPCPFCGGMQYLKWEQFDWVEHGTPEWPVYICEHCYKPIDYSHHRWMMERMEERAHAVSPGHASFWVWAAYSYAPGAHWRTITKEYIAAEKELKENRNPELMKTWVNTYYGDDFEEESRDVNINQLFDRRENYLAVVPYDSAVLIGTVDTQDDRLELLVTAWGLQEECHILEHVILWGNPHYKEVWTQLDSHISRKYEHEGGLSIGLHAVGIDTGGHCTTEVYDYVRPRQGRGVYALKGSSQPGAPVISRPGTTKTNKGGVKLYHIGTTAIKDTLSQRLEITEPGPRMIHFPDTLDYDFFEQLCNEHKTLRYRKGLPVHAWEPKKAGAKVEAWDLLVYSYAMMRNICKSAEILDSMVRQLQQRCSDRRAGVAERPALPGRRVISKGIE